jgi:hypothetical protein
MFGDFDPLAVEAALRFKPDRTWRTGDARVPNSKLKHESAGWCIELPQQPGWELGPLVSQLLDRLSAVHAEVRAVQLKFGLRSQLTCVVYADDQMPAVGLSSSVVASLADLQASVDIDIMLTDLPDESP